MKHNRWLVLPLVLSFFYFNAAQAQNLSWNQYVEQLRSEALAEGVRPEIFDNAFRDIHAPNLSVLHLDRTQPERRISYLKYQNTRADAYRIKLGRQEYRRHHQVLDDIANKYGVNACFIVSLWGLETSYGRFMGSFPVIKALATLGYNNRRSEYFRKQLMLALHILNDGHVNLADFKGEWAGASGHPQFMPSSWQQYAVDFDRDGRRDIWHSLDDSFASIANYLAMNGWQRGQPWAREVIIPANFDNSLADGKIFKTVAEWQQLGIHLKNSADLNPQLSAAIIEPDGGPAFMIFNNFKVIMKWNHSTYYAGTVGYMAEQICKTEL